MGCIWDMNGFQWNFNGMYMGLNVSQAINQPYFDVTIHLW